MHKNSHLPFTWRCLKNVFQLHETPYKRFFFSRNLNCPELSPAGHGLPVEGSASQKKKPHRWFQVEKTPQGHRSPSPRSQSFHILTPEQSIRDKKSEFSSSTSCPSSVEIFIFFPCDFLGNPAVNQSISARSLLITPRSIFAL